MTTVRCETTPSPSKGRVASPAARVASSTSVTCSEAMRLPSSFARKLLFLCTRSPFTAPESPARKPAACCGSKTIAAFCVLTLRAPSMRAAQFPGRVDVLDGRIVLALRSAAELAASGQLVELVLGCPLRQRHRAFGEAAQAVLGEVGPVREPEPARGEDPQPDALAGGLLKLLDVPVTYLDRRFARPLRVRL